MLCNSKLHSFAVKVLQLDKEQVYINMCNFFLFLVFFFFFFRVKKPEVQRNVTLCHVYSFLFGNGSMKHGFSQEQYLM